VKVLAVVLAVGLALTGCAQSGSDADFAAEELQRQVLDVTTASAEQNYSEALVRLAELEASVKDDLARGEISQARYESVMAAIELVRADLEAAAAEPTPTPTPTPTPKEDAGNDDNPGKGNKDKDD
jgi:L-fucose mutarotase/ribose pyranase (RbsD/FucU family)